MRKVVEKTGSTYEEAVEKALADLGVPRERAEVVLLHARDTDRRHPGPEEYMVRAWERDAMDEPAAERPDRNVPPAAPLVCEKTAGSYHEAVQACLTSLGISEMEADIQVIQRQDTNPLKSGPERITVRVWRRRLTEPALRPDETGAERVSDVHAAAHLPDDAELNFESPLGTQSAGEGGVAGQ